MFSSMGQDIHYSQFSTAPLYLNPAHTGAFDGLFRVAFNQKTQWLAVTKPFVSFSGSFDAPVYKSNGKRQLIGMGVILNSDNAGDSRYSTLQACLTISYTKALDRKNKNKLSLGFYGGLMQRSLEYDKLTFDEQYQLGVFNPTNPITETFGKEKFSFFDCRSEEHTSELQSPDHLVCRLLLEKKKPHKRWRSGVRYGRNGLRGRLLSRAS